jgi:hypothetical protein
VADIVAAVSALVPLPVSARHPIDT